jgi:hypothetical protein
MTGDEDPRIKDLDGIDRRVILRMNGVLNTSFKDDRGETFTFQMVNHGDRLFLTIIEPGGKTRTQFLFLLNHIVRIIHHRPPPPAAIAAGYVPPPRGERPW